MATIVTRSGKGSALTHTEMDANFTNLNTDKLENVSEDATPELKYSGSTKLATTSTGIDVTGGITATNGQLNISNGYGLLWGNTAFYGSDATGTEYLRADVNGAEAMRIDSSGNVLIAVSSWSTLTGAGNSGTGFENTTGKWVSGRTSTATQYHTAFINPNGQVGSISTSGTSTAYNTSSDYRLKENVVPMSGSIDRLKQLNPVNFNFIADADTTVDGFLAHEVSDIVPEAISGEKDAMRTEEYEVEPAVKDDDGNVVTEAVMGEREVPDYQGIDQAKLVPLLTSALQEAVAKIEALETSVSDLTARIEALENA